MFFNQWLKLLNRLIFYLYTAAFSPVISSLTSSLSSPLNSRVTLVCNATAEPSAMISWFLNQGDNIEIELVNETDSVLVLDPLRPADIGIYTCVATNELSSDRQTTFVIIEGK